MGVNESHDHQSKLVQKLEPTGFFKAYQHKSNCLSSSSYVTNFLHTILLTEEFTHCFKIGFKISIVSINLIENFAVLPTADLLGSQLLPIQVVG